MNVSSVNKISNIKISSQHGTWWLTYLLHVHAGYYLPDNWGHAGYNLPDNWGHVGYNLPTHISSFPDNLGHAGYKLPDNWGHTGNK